MNAALPPQNIDAEESALGAMMLSPTAIEKVSDISLGAGAFYRQSHGVIFSAILSLYEKNQPADAITVVAELNRTGLLEAAGGAQRVHEIASLVPAASNAAHYAKIVRETATRRDLIRLTNETAQKAYEGGVAGDLVAELDGKLLRLQAAMRNKQSSVFTGKDLASKFRYRLEHPEEFSASIPPPFHFLEDQIVDGQLHILAGYQGTGKLLDLRTPLPTPSGWTTIGDVQVGDTIFDEQGKPCVVLGRTETVVDAKTYELTFSDGEKIIACADHLWLTETIQERASISRARRRTYKDDSPYSRRQERLQPTVRTTQEIVDTLYVGDDWRGEKKGRWANHAIRNTQPLELPEVDLPIDPYLLGAWLGDGHTHSATITTTDQEILNAFEDAGHEVTHRGRYAYGVVRGGFNASLRKAGVFGNKHVPSAYLRASVEQRLELVRGLMDTDGGVSRGRCEFTSTLPQLADAMHELLSSLGIKSTIRTNASRLYGVEHKPRHRVTFTTTRSVFRVRRKLERLQSSVPDVCTYRTITEAREIPSIPMRCLRVSSPSSLFLAGRSMIPTHNSALVWQFAEAALAKEKRVGIWTLEMTPEQLGDRLITNHGVPAIQVRKAQVDGMYRSSMETALEKLERWPVEVHNDPAITPESIRRQQRQSKYDLILIDHLHNLPVKNPAHKRIELEEAVRKIAALAVELKVPIILLAQLSRGTLHDPFPRPTRVQLRETGMIENLAALIWFIWRKWDGTRFENEAEFICDKNRFGPEGQWWRLHFRASQVRFTETST